MTQLELGDWVNYSISKFTTFTINLRKLPMRLWPSNGNIKLKSENWKSYVGIFLQDHHYLNCSKIFNPTSTVDLYRALFPTFPTHPLWWSKIERPKILIFWNQRGYKIRCMWNRCRPKETDSYLLVTSASDFYTLNERTFASPTILHVAPDGTLHHSLDVLGVLYLV